MPDRFFGEPSADVSATCAVAPRWRGSGRGSGRRSSAPGASARRCWPSPRRGRSGGATQSLRLRWIGGQREGGEKPGWGVKRGGEKKPWMVILAWVYLGVGCTPPTKRGTCTPRTSGCMLIGGRVTGRLKTLVLLLTWFNWCVKTPGCY